jgi:tetratricopeptide (TPR) repeat protein
LKGVGRLDVMTAVNERAMKYYGGQEALEGLPAESLERRARILHAMGEDDEKRGDLGLALKKFEEARRTTSAVLAKRPEDTDAIFSHAQSEFWVGSVAYQKQDRKRAYEHFERYVELAGLLNKIDPGNPDWFRELSYANGNICAVSLDKPVDSARANQYCAQALKIAERIHLTFPSSIQSYKDLINGYGWMATTYQESGKIKYSIGLRQKQEKILQEIFSKNPEDRSIIAINMKMKVAFSDALIIDKNFEEAKNKYDDAYSSYIKLITTDKSNNSWLIWEKRLKSIDNSLKDHFNG